MNTNQTEAKKDMNSKPRTQSFFIEPKVRVSKDGQYLIINLPGNMIVRKHINYFKAILGVAFEPKAQLAAATSGAPVL